MLPPFTERIDMNPFLDPIPQSLKPYFQKLLPTAILAGVDYLEGEPIELRYALPKTPDLPKVRELKTYRYYSTPDWDFDLIRMHPYLGMGHAYAKLALRLDGFHAEWKVDGWIRSIEATYRPLDGIDWPHSQVED